MRKIPLEPGRAALSKAGRDAGRRFAVLRVDGTFAYIADGDLRKAESPKKKKHRHLRATQEFFPSLAEILKNGKVPLDSEIRRCLSDKTPRED
ncbi:MAG: KOW domain-containing RNA-binding protein [Firmicutes bacterium]|nr:KOW domain-containing RNA-binding protein [Bacillota bacterium]